MKILVKDFITEMQEKHIENTKLKPTAVSDFIKEKLEIRIYIPFNEKRQIIEAVVEKNISYEDGIVRIDTVSQFVSFVIAMIISHTNLQMSDNPIDDYDLICEAGVLGAIVNEFKQDYDECSTLLNMVVDKALVNNNLNIIVGKFLNGVLDKLDVITDALGSKIDGFDMGSLLGDGINEESIAQLTGLLDKLNIK